MGLIRIISLAIFAALFGVAVWLWDPLAKPPSAEALSDMAANYDVEIIRDDWGVPHIYGAHDNDVAFGLAYANAEDDFDEIQASIAVTRGVLGRYQGADAAKTDYIVSLFQVHETVEARYADDIPDEVKEYARAYVAGLNLYAAENRDKVWPGLAPFREKDIYAAFIFRTPFFYGFDKTLLDLLDDEREKAVALDPSAGAQSWHVTDNPGAARGSNAFAVAPHRSGDGATRLLLNSHQPMQGPVTWWEAHLVSETGLDITGGLFAGTPVVLHGFNKHLGWAATVNSPDLADVYALTLNPENPDQYRLDGEWLDFEKSTANLKVRLFGPFALKVKREVLRSVHGPVLKTKTGAYALRYAGMGEIRQMEQYYRMNRATTREEFLDSMAMNALPNINYIYADKEGKIMFLHNGQYPARPADKDNWDWSGDLPGDRSDLIWDGYRPFSEAPILKDPASGFIYNANNTPYAATDGDDNLKPEDFPASMGLQTDYTSRAMRILELLPDYPVMDKEALLAIKFDDAYAQGSKAAKLVKTVLAMDWSEDPQLAAAADHLRQWDLRTNIENRHAALGVLTTILEVTEKYTGLPAPAPEDAFRNAVEYLMTHHDRIDPPWGEVNRLTHGEVDVPVDGAPDVLRAIYPAGIGEDGALRASAGDTWIGLVEWDANGQQSAEVIHQFGTATADENSPHYADQAVLFAEKKWRKANLTRADVEAAAACIYRPGRVARDGC